MGSSGGEGEGKGWLEKTGWGGKGWGCSGEKQVGDAAQNFFFQNQSKTYIHVYIHVASTTGCPKSYVKHRFPILIL